MDTIEVGDIVAVNVHGGQHTISHRAEVLYKPCATGDSWIFRDTDTNNLHYVSEGCTITKKATPCGDAPHRREDRRAGEVAC